MSNESKPKGYDSAYYDQVKGKNQTGGVKGGTSIAKPVSVESSSSSGSSGGSGGSSGGGGGGGVAPAPGKDETRAIVMAGMKQYLGREATKKEVNAFFKKFTDYSAKNENTTNAGMQEEFMQDWIEDRPKLRKEYAQYSVATRYMDAFDRALSSAKEL
jgi:hypothetical protein